MEKMALADAMILGSPTYMTDVSAELKALLERSGFVALANMRKLGEIIAWLGSAMKPHLDSFPKKSGHVQTEARDARVDKQL